MKKQEKQKQKIKEVLLKILHIVSYVLSLAFIGLCILTGVQSCSKPKGPGQKVNRDYLVENIRANNFYDNFAYSYTSKYSGTNTIVTNEVQNNLLTSISNYNIYQQFDSDFELPKYYNLTGVYVFDSNLNEFVNVNGVYIVFNTFYNGYSGYYLRLKHIYFNGFGYCEKTLLNQDGSAYNSTTYNFDTYWLTSINNKFYCSTDSLNDNPLFNIFFNEEPITPYNFTFNYQFNYNAPIGAMLDNSIYYIEEFNTSEYLPFIVRKISCLFVVNGELFNEMWFTYYRANDNIYYYDDFGRITLWEGTTNDTHGYFHDLKFVNTLSNNKVEVYRRRIYSQYEQGYSLLDNGGYWVSNYYQNITLLNTDDNLNLTLSKLNNTERATTGVTGGNYGDMFGLLTSAFTSLLPILNISIIPGITLGLLLFIPLIVILISVVVRLIKK